MWDVVPIISLQASCPFLTFRQARITLASRLANSLAVSFPIPPLAPGINHTNVTNTVTRCDKSLKGTKNNFLEGTVYSHGTPK